LTTREKYGRIKSKRDLLTDSKKDEVRTLNPSRRGEEESEEKSCSFYLGTEDGNRRQGGASTFKGEDRFCKKGYSSRGTLRCLSPDKWTNRTKRGGGKRTPDIPLRTCPWGERSLIRRGG